MPCSLCQSIAIELCRPVGLQNSKTSFLAHVQLRGIDGMGVVSRVTQRISHELNIIKSLSFESDQGIFTGHISLFCQ